MNQTPLLLIDSYSQIYRGYYAVRSLSTSKGEPSNAVFAMAKLLFKLQQEYGDRDGAFVFDKGKCSARLELAPEYKANRPPMPDDLRSQIEVIRELIRAFGWNIIEQESLEADDLIGCIATANNSRDVLILSSDKDLSQLINRNIRMLVPDRDGKGLLLRDEAATIEKFGVPPAGIVDYLALIGDSSDNIPGVEGVGPKTAADLIREFGSIDAILAEPQKIKREALRGKITGAAEILRLNQKLIQLDLSAEISGFDLTKKEPDYPAIRKIAEQMELKSILKDMDKQQLPELPAKQEKQETRNTQMEFDF